MKKIFIVFFVLSSVTLFSAEPVYRGKAFLPRYDGVVLSMEELNAMKEKIDEGEKQAKLNQQYFSLIDDYRKLRDIQQAQIDQFTILDKLKQESIQIYRESIKSYKDIIGEMRENNLRIEKQLGQQRKTSRWQRNLNFLLGFAAPILGAKALDSIR